MASIYVTFNPLYVEKVMEKSDLTLGSQTMSHTGI